MGIIDRYLERRGFVKAQDVRQKSAGFMTDETEAYPTRRPDEDRIADYKTFIAAYRRLPWLYAGGTALAVAATKPVLKCYVETKKGDKVEQAEIGGTDLTRLLEIPNPQVTWRELLQVTVLNLYLTGNQYWNLVGTREGQPISKSNRPVEIWWVKPESMQPIPNDDGTIKGYEYTSPIGKKRMLDPSEVIHFRMANPGSYHVGMGVMEPLTETATLEFHAMNFQRHFMENDATPPFCFNHPGDPNEKQRRDFFKAWDERHGGPKKTNRPGMVWGGMKIEPLGQSMKDAQYPELRKMNREEILAGLGVPPSVVGLLEYANYSNMEVQQKKFWEDTVIPVLGIVADMITLRVAPLFDERAWFEFDYSDIKVLQEDEERKSRIAAALISNGIKTPNQVRASMYNEDPYVGGDQYFMSMALLPIGADPVKAAEKRAKARALPKGAETAEEKPKESFWRNDERRKALWQSFEKRVASMERAVQPEVEKYLRRQADDVKAKAAASGSVAGMSASGLFDVKAEGDIYLGKFEARYRQAFERGGNAGLSATKGMIWIPPEVRKLKDEDGFKVTPEHVEKLKSQIENAAKYFNETTWKVVEVEINNALAAGMTVEEAAQEIWKSLVDRTPWESRRIARTEMARTENWGGLEGYKQNEYVTHKGWMCSFVEDSRDEHMEADGQEVEIDADFTVGGEQLAYPGDPRGSAGMVINCLCSHYPVVEGV
jgi:HK97 family phage portal protein